MVTATTLLAVFVVGLGAGATIRRVFTGYERGCMSILMLLLFGIVVLFAVFLAARVVLDAFDWNVSPDQERTINLLFWPAAVGGVLIARFWPRSTKVSDRRRIVSPAGTHDVPAEIRQEPKSDPPPPNWPAPPAP